MKRYSQLLLGLVVSTLFASSVWALSLDQAKQQSLVGETPSGYLAAVRSGDSAAQGVVDQINNARKAKYQQIAAKNGTSLSAVELLAGKKAIESSPAGYMVQLPNGSWTKK